MDCISHTVLIDYTEVDLGRTEGLLCMFFKKYNLIRLSQTY